MRVSLQWLKELVTCEPDDLQPEALAERLSVAGFEVEEILDLAAQAAGVVVGHVAERQPHPNADKLSVCRVEVGGAEPLQIVCGAANVRAGIHVPVALVGATLPAVELTIKPAELRGVASSGMICSLRELGLADASDGIAVLDEILETVPALGTPVGPALGLDDQVLELAITANRPDGLSMAGIAREVAALVGGSTSLPAPAPAVAAEPLPVPAEARRCLEEGGLFSLTVLEGVQVRPSPPWLQQRLERAGLRPINNVVDITNLVMLETGQPLHAFDRDRSRPTRGARRGGGGGAPAGAPRRAAHHPGWRATGAQPGSPAGDLRRSAHRPGRRDGRPAGGGAGGHHEPLAGGGGVRSPGGAALRPQRGTAHRGQPPLREGPAAGSHPGGGRSGGGAAGGAGRCHGARPLAAPETQRTAPAPALRRDALHNLLGPVLVDDGEVDLEDGRIVATLTALGCTLEEDGDEGWRVTVPPSRRMDLLREVDLIEEVARLVGYDRFACHLPDPLEPGGLDPSQQAERRLRTSLCNAGLQETCTLSLVPEAEGRLPLANPLLADYGHLRDNLHEELLQAARRNLQASQPGFWAYEIGTVFSAEGRESRELVGVISGERRSERWSSSGKPQPPDYFAARGRLQAALDDLKLPVEDRPLRDHPLLHPGRAATVAVEGRPAGWFGQLHPEQAEALDLPEATYLFRLSLAPLLTAATRRNRWQPAFAPFATVPASERDLALVVPRSTQAGDLLSAIRKAGKPLLEGAELVDRYSGSQLGDDECSQAFRLRYRDPKRTLTDEQVEAAHAKVRAALEKQFGARLRS